MKILVIGKNGQLGQSLKRITHLSNSENIDTYVFVGKEEIDLTDLNSIKSYFANRSYDLIVNCAAYTQVDKAEDDEIQAKLVNYNAVKEIAKIANNKNIALIHISTDYVFDGKKVKPYNENDIAFPLNSYGRSKLMGENALLSVMNINALIIRTGWVYSEFGNNFVKTILNLAVNKKCIHIVSDQFGTPTYAYDIARAILVIINSNRFVGKGKQSKIYNFTNGGGCSWFNFASEILNVAGIDCVINPIRTEEYPLTAKRPKYSILNKALIIKDYGLTIRHWKKSLKVCLKNLK